MLSHSSGVLSARSKTRRLYRMILANELPLLYRRKVNSICLQIFIKKIFSIHFNQTLELCHVQNGLITENERTVFSGAILAGTHNLKVDSPASERL